MLLTTASNHSSGVVNRKSGSSIDLAQVVQIIGPLLAVFEFEGEDGIVSVLTFGLLCDAQACSAFLEDV